MANYVFVDRDRTRKLYANDNNIMAYKSVRCYCKNEKCDARMFVYDPEHPNRACFKASGKPPHCGACGYESKGFRITEYKEEKFVFPDTLYPLLKDVEKKESKKAKHGGISRIGGIEEKTLSGLKEVYYMLQSYDISDKYNGYRISDLIADERTYRYYKGGIEGYKIVECNAYRYKKETLTMYMNYPVFPNVKGHLILEFCNEELLKKMIPRMVGKKHDGLVVVFGKWRHDEKFSYVRIDSENQISVIKKES